MYLTYDEFAEIVSDSEITEDEFNTLIERAQSDIDRLTFNRITEQGFENLTEFQQEKIKLACALQLQFEYDNDELINSPLSSYSISGVSMSFDRSKVFEFGGIIILGRAYSVLLQTGLCYKGLM